MRKILCCILIFMIVAGTSVGCSQENAIETSAQQTQGEITTPGTPNQVAVSVQSLKEKYGESDDGRVLPLYNIAANKPLQIAFKYTLDDHLQAFSLHTDSKCLESSRVNLFINMDNDTPTGPKVYEIYPSAPPLMSVKFDGLWGGVSQYYLKLNYDITAETKTVLEVPVIIPVSIQSTVPVPNVGYRIDNGCFTLTWTPVENATAYYVYHRPETYTPDGFISGNEEAYQGPFPSLVSMVSASTLSYSNWDITNETNPDEAMTTEKQNQNISGEYYVTAAINGIESRMSFAVRTSQLALPTEIADASLALQTFETPEDLPSTIAIRYTDGSVQNHEVLYEYFKETQVIYTIDGTILRGITNVKNRADTITKQVVPSTQPEKIIKNEIPQHAPINVPTVKHAIAGKTLLEQQIEYTSTVLAQANQTTVLTHPDITICANSAAEEYLIWQMINHAPSISLSGFPELQTWNALNTTILNVLSQNETIQSVCHYNYYYDNMILQVTYDIAED